MVITAFMMRNSCHATSGVASKQDCEVPWKSLNLVSKNEWLPYNAVYICVFTPGFLCCRQGLKLPTLTWIGWWHRETLCSTLPTSSMSMMSTKFVAENVALSTRSNCVSILAKLSQFLSPLHDKRDKPGSPLFRENWGTSIPHWQRILVETWSGLYEF